MAETGMLPDAGNEPLGGLLRWDATCESSRGCDFDGFDAAKLYALTGVPTLAKTP